MASSNCAFHCRSPGLAGVRHVAVALAALIALAPVAAMANVGPRSWSGDPAGEPVGITDITILREDLEIDLRPLANHGPVTVAATYHLDNRATDKHLDLVFASGSGMLTDFRVTLDARPVASAPVRDATLPDSWRAPGSTPLPDGTGELDYELRDRVAPVGFQLDVGPGRHELSIRYAARATEHHHDEVTLLHQFAYVLSPARAWAGFADLDVTVRVPPGWRAATSPALGRDHDMLHSEFTSVPADAIALTVQAPAGAYWLVQYAGYALFALVTFGGGIAVYRRARSADQRRAAAGQLPSSMTTLARGLTWSIAFFAAGQFAIFGPDLALPEGQADHYGYGQVAAAMLVGIAAVVVLVIGVVIAHVASRHAYAAATGATNAT